jgi:hypothetical protein
MVPPTASATTANFAIPADATVANSGPGIINVALFAKARMLAEEQKIWQNQYTPAWGNSRHLPASDFAAPEPSFDEITSGEGWKQPPSASERESIDRDDWK